MIEPGYLAFRAESEGGRLPRVVWALESTP